MKSQAKSYFLTAIAATLILSACSAPAAPAPTTAPAAAPAATEVPKPTEAPKATEAKPTEAPKAEEVKPTEAPKAEAKPAEGMMLPAVDPLKLEGKIIAAGSSTVFPLTEKVAEVVKDEGFKGEVTIDNIGTGAGFERFCKGETDITNASRKINEKETAACKVKGIEPVSFQVGVDALTVVVNPKNPVKGVTQAQLADIYSGKIKNWKEIDPAFDKEVKLFSPGTDSGTFDYFVEHLYKKDKKPILEANPQLSENDNVLVQGVEGDEGAIGYFGFAYFLGEGSKLKALELDGVAPNAETAQGGKYGLARPLFIYSSAKIMKEKPQVAGFINFYLSKLSEVLGPVGYFASSADATNGAKQAWMDASK